ncbi:MAG: hypothetical protein AAGF11_36130 [Myxococcota bacterium]
MTSKSPPARPLGPYAPFTTLLALGFCACGADDARVVTHIEDRAVVMFDRPLCRDDIALIEETIAHVEQSLDVKVEVPIEIAIWNRYANVADHCGEGPSGCYTNGEIHTLWQALEHEIVHAVAAPLGRPEPLWTEGIAEALSNRTRVGHETVDAQLGLEDSRQVNYSTAGHFTRWLLEEYGVDGLRALARERSFEDAYGLNLTDTIADYEARAPWSYPHWNPCRGQALDASPANVWVDDIAVDCAAPWSSTMYNSGPTVVRTLDIEQPGTYRLFITGATMVGALACQIDVLPDRPDDDMAGDIIRESTRDLPTFFVSDELYEIVLKPGRLQFSFTVEDEAATVGFELRRIGS